jgi:hypothetical protein
MTVTLYPGYSQTIVEENLRCQTIASVTKANPCVVTTTNNHGYPAGVKVRFLIPTQFGMLNLNLVNIQVISVTLNTLTLNLDSTNFNTFSYPNPLPSAYTPIPYGNQDSFEGVIYNNGTPSNPINGM